MLQRSTFVGNDGLHSLIKLIALNLGPNNLEQINTTTLNLHYQDVLYLHLLLKCTREVARAEHKKMLKKSYD